MKKIPKKLFSLFIAVVMAVASLPAFPLVSSADSTSGVEDLTADISYSFDQSGYYNYAGSSDSGKYSLTDSSGLKYDVEVSSKDLARPGGTLNHETYANISNGEAELYFAGVYLNDDSVKNIVKSSNFSVTFNYTRTADNYEAYGDSENYLNLLDDVLFSVSDGTTDYIRLLQNGSLFVYHNGQYVQSSDEVVLPPTGQEVSYTITYDASTGTTSLYLEGVLTQTITGYTLGMGADCYATIGHTYAQNGDYVMGLLSDLKFYSKTLDEIEIRIGKTVPRATLEECINSFETLMCSGNYYRNSAEAYKYYNEALRLIEVGTYGTVNVDAQKAECLKNFSAAFDDMALYDADYNTSSIYTLYTSQQKVGSGILAQTGTYYNDSTMNNGGWGETALYEKQSPKCVVNAYGDRYVMLYDGTTEISAPIKVMYYRENSDTGRLRGLYAIDVKNDDLEWVTQEAGSIYLLNTETESVVDFGWPSWSSNNSQKVSNDSSVYSGFGDSTSGHYYGFGYVTLKTAPTAYSETIYPQVSFINHDKDTVTIGYGDGIDSSNDAYCSTYQIINIEPLINSINEFANYLKDNGVENLSYSEAYQAFTQVDNLANFNPKADKYNYITNNGTMNVINSDAVTECANDIKNLVNGYTEVFSKLAEIDSDGYDALETVVKDQDVIKMYDDNNSNSVYTTDSFNAFKNAYESAVGKINELATDGKNFESELNSDKTENTTVIDIVKAVYVAYYELAETADFSALREIVNRDDVVNAQKTRLGTVEDQNYTIGSWITFDKYYDDSVAFNKENTQDSESNIPMYATKEQQFTVNGVTVTANAPDKSTFSTQQQQCEDLVNGLDTSVGALVSPAEDYSVYDALTEILAMQDLAAFTNEYKENEASIVKLFAKNGTSTSAPEFVVGEDSGETAYCSYQGEIYKNASNIDTIITQLMTELNDANASDTKRVSYNVTFNVSSSDGTVQTIKNAETHYYGDVIELDASDYLPEGKSCFKWVVTDSSGEKLVYSSSDIYKLKLQSDSTVTAYYDNFSEDSISVTVYDQNGNVVQKLGVSGDSQINFAESSVTINGETIEIVDVPFYTFSNWNINGKVPEYDKTYTATEMLNGKAEISVRPIYNSSKEAYHITIDNEQVATDVFYDDTISVKSNEADVYAIAIYENEQYSIVTYGNSYTFYACRDMNFYSVTNTDGVYKVNDTIISDESTVFALDNKLPFVYSAAVNSSTETAYKFSTYSSFTVNTGTDVVITEIGTLYTLGADLATTELMQESTEGVNCIKAKNIVSEDYGYAFNSNQYSLTLNKGTDKDTTVYTRAYVKYKFTYTDKNGNKVTVQSVAYGNICNDLSLYNN